MEPKRPNCLNMGAVSHPKPAEGMIPPLKAERNQLKQLMEENIHLILSYLEPELILQFFWQIFGHLGTGNESFPAIDRSLKAEVTGSLEIAVSEGRN